MVWVPGNTKDGGGRPARQPGRGARLSRRTRSPARTTPRCARRFLRNADAAIAYLEAHTSLRLQPVRDVSGLLPRPARRHARRPGAGTGAVRRARASAQAFALLRPPLPEFTLFGGMMVHRADIPHFRRVGPLAGAPPCAWRAAAGAHAWQRLLVSARHDAGLGNALAARLLHVAAAAARGRCGCGCHADGAADRGGAVRGVHPSPAGTIARRARGVVLATGGFSHDPALRAAHCCRPAAGMAVRRRARATPATASASASPPAASWASGAARRRVLGAGLALPPRRRHARRVPAHRHRPRQARRDRGQRRGPALRQRGGVVPRVRAGHAARRQRRRVVPT